MTDISKVNVNRIEGLEQILSQIKYVIDSKTTENQWYRKWSDGWIEQGGICYVPDVGSNGTVDFLIPFQNIPFAVASKYEGGSYTESSGGLISVTTTSITCGLRWGGDISRGGRNCSYYACGY